MPTQEQINYRCFIHVIIFILFFIGMLINYYVNYAPEKIGSRIHHPVSIGTP